MHPTEIENVLDRMVIYVDTREHDTDRFRRRMDIMGKWERHFLDFADYSAVSYRDNGEEITLEGKVHIERKMSIAEVIGNFTEAGSHSPDVVKWNQEHPDIRLRNRFEWELKRAQMAGAKIYLVIENGSWEHIYGHKYKSKMNEKAVVATLMAYQARYNLQIVFVGDRLSGTVIKDILKYEMREVLKGYE